MKDPIERRDAIGAVKKHYRAHDNDLLELIAFDIERLPSAQSEPQWISCSERLPEIDELVLVTDDSGGVKTVDVDRCGQYECSEKRFWYYTQNVVAWMPLPEPYVERREE